MYLSEVRGATYGGDRVNRDPQPTTTSTRTQTYLADLANQRTANQANSVQQTRTQFQGAPQSSMEMVQRAINQGGSYLGNSVPNATQQNQTQNNQVFTLPQGDYDKNDPFEVMQRDTRQGKYQDLFAIPNNGEEHFFRDFDGTKQIPANLQALLDKYKDYGLVANYVDNNPDYGSGWSVTGDTTKLVEGMPKSAFGEYRNLATLNSDDRNNVRDPRYVYFDPNYGWVTHRKNYDQTADDSWFMRNAKTIVPTLATMGLGALGVPSMVLSGVGAGRGIVDVLGGKAPWESLLPSLIAAGFSLSGANEILGKLAPYIRSGVNYGVGQLTNRGN